MSWNPIAIQDVLDEFTPQEQAALQNIQGSSLVFARILAKAVGSARGKIAAGGNQLDEDGTIPDQMRSEVIDITRWRWLISFPTLKALQTKERKDAYDEAMSALREISKKNSDIKVELPNAATAQNNPSPVNSIAQVSGSGKCGRQFTRERTKGL